MRGLLSTNGKKPNDDPDEPDITPNTAPDEMSMQPGAVNDPDDSAGDGESADENPDENPDDQGDGDQEGGQEGGNDNQGAYNQFVTNGAKLIYNKQTLPQLLKSIAGNGNPVAGIITTLFSVVHRLETSAQQAGHPLPPDVIAHGASELLQMLAELAAKAKIHKFSDKELQAVFETVGQMRGKMAAAQGQQPQAGDQAGAQPGEQAPPPAVAPGQPAAQGLLSQG